jgi:hypothetical protein
MCTTLFELKLSLCLINSEPLPDDFGYRRRLTSVLSRGEWTASCPAQFTPGGKSLFQLGRRIGWPQSRTERCKEVSMCSESNPDSPTAQPYPVVRSYLRVRTKLDTVCVRP